MARFKTNNVNGTALYASRHMDHPICNLKYGTEVAISEPPEVGPVGHGNIRHVHLVLNQNLYGWVYASELSLP